MRVLTLLSRWLRAIRTWLSSSRQESLFELAPPKPESAASLSLVPALPKPPLSLVTSENSFGMLPIAGDAANDERELNNVIRLRPFLRAVTALSSSFRTGRRAAAKRLRVASMAERPPARVYSLALFRCRRAIAAAHAAQRA